jgi:endonuclease/exonuclease/phosphatase family metal-dependent hydrolase
MRVKIRTKLGWRISLLTVILFAIVLLPYCFSRVASCWRRVSVHSIEELSVDHHDDTAMKIACYNIAHGRGLAASNWEGGTAEARRTRLSQIADVLRALDADIVVLNEVDFDSSWSKSTNQAHYLATHAGYSYWAEQRNLDFRVLIWKWRFGNAILSKYPIIQASVIELPAYSSFETFVAGKKRGVNCIISVNGDKLRIIGVHLSHRSEVVRTRSAEMLIEIASSDTVPTIVAGDLNSSPTGFPNSQSDKNIGNAVDLLDVSSLFQRRPEQSPVDPAELTFRSDQPKSIIDWILVPRNCRILDYRVNSSTLSDHRPVVAKLSMDIIGDATVTE